MICRPDWMCWPDLRVIVRPFPWTWRIRPHTYADDNGARSVLIFGWLFVTVEWWGQDPGTPLFPMTAADPTPPPETP